MKKEIVDNEMDDYTMADFLNENIPQGIPKIDVASGYFNSAGFGAIRSALWAVSQSPKFRMRLLFGREAIHRSAGILDAPGREEGLAEEIEEEDISEKSAELIDDLISFLKLNSVEVRQNPNRFNHAKCYILDEAAAVGSSNFTGAGLRSNVELNAILLVPSAQEKVREWFEKRWSEGMDTKLDLINLLEESKFGLPIEPFVAYMKFLYEYYKPRLLELEETGREKIELATFQEDAVKTAMRIIRRFQGVIIADSTGLGKTHIGLELLRRLVHIERKRAILIAPKQVLVSVWEPRLDEAMIKTRNVSMEIIGTESFRPEDYIDYDVVLIDESHNFRNSSTNRRLNLMKLLTGGKRKLVILQSATPVNNSLMDLYYQLSLISAGDDAHFVDLDIPDLRQHFLSADKKKIATGVEDIVRLLDDVMIRRTRQFIKENYPDATINGKPVTFPKRKLKKVEYTLTEIFGTTVYSQVLDTIDRLNLVPYRVDTYSKEIEKEEKAEIQIRAELQKYGLLKRFESSVVAIRESVARLIKFYEFFEKALDEGLILDSKSFRYILSELQDETEEINEGKILAKLLEAKLIPLSSGDYDVRAMKKELKQDLDLLRPLHKGLSDIHPYSDRKLTRLKELFDEDHIFQVDGKKVVIFTQFVDTAKYIVDELD